MTDRAQGKKAYSPPSLKIYGGLAKMTATGTQNVTENAGMPTGKL